MLKAELDKIHDFQKDKVILPMSVGPLVETQYFGNHI
jgi:hypothetical protein